jgi:mannose-6-phosphate isomerase-like protein (cupin superfamily)
MKMTMAIVAAVALALPAVALAADKAIVISAKDVQAQIAKVIPQAKATGSGGGTLLKNGNLGMNLSVRTSSGGAEIHAHFDDVMIVQQGSATLITGGTVVDAKTSAEGETKGPSIKGGTEQTISTGDTAVVPAGVPHQLLIKPGTVYAALVAKVKE